MKLPGKPHSRYVQTHNDGMKLERGQFCTIEELKLFAMEVAEYFAREKNWGSSNPMNFNTRFEDFWQELTK